MSRDEAKLRYELVEAGKLFAERGLAIGTAGNLSVKLDDGYLVTPTNARLGALDPARLSKLDREFRHVSGDKPTKEVSMHAAFYETRDGTEAVVHLHSTYAAAFSCRADLPEIDPIAIFSPYYVMRVGHVRVLPYFRPGSDEIGMAIRGLKGQFRSVLLQNHGPVNAGSSLVQAIGAAEELEETVRMLLVMAGQPLRLLKPAEIEDLVQAFALDW